MILDNINNFLKYARSSESSLLAYDFIMNFKRKNCRSAGMNSTGTAVMLWCRNTKPRRSRKRTLKATAVT